MVNPSDAAKWAVSLGTLDVQRDVWTADYTPRDYRAFLLDWGEYLADQLGIPVDSVLNWQVESPTPMGMFYREYLTAYAGGLNPPGIVLGSHGLWEQPTQITGELADWLNSEAPSPFDVSFQLGKAHGLCDNATADYTPAIWTDFLLELASELTAVAPVCGGLSTTLAWLEAYARSTLYEEYLNGYLFTAFN